MKFDPRKPFDIWLDCFADVPKEDRPVFTVRRCTASEWEAFGEALERQEDAKKATHFEMSCHAIVGWKNQYDPSTYDPETGECRAIVYSRDTASQDLRKLLSGVEIYEVFGKIMSGQQPTAEDKKKSLSPH